MSEPYILGDWSVSQCRLYLMKEGEDGPIDRGLGPGIKFCDDPATAYRDMTSEWRAKSYDISALICGSVGANIGWRDAGYVTAPTGLEDIASARIDIPASRVTLLPGVRTDANAFGTPPDVMRSEDMQALGWCRLTGRADAMLCLPGSHTKWVEVRGSRIESFTTSFVGELFDVLRSHSILVGSREGTACGHEFAEGVELGQTHPAPLAGLFDIRARAAQNLEDGAASQERLSGYLIGADVSAMLKALGRAPDAIIGEGEIAKRYAKAVSQLGVDVPIHDGESAVLAGLMAARDTIRGTPPSVTH